MKLRTDSELERHLTITVRAKLKQKPKLKITGRALLKQQLIVHVLANNNSVCFYRERL